MVNYAIEFEFFGTEVFQEIISPTFIVLATTVSFTILIVVVLIGVLCSKLCSLGKKGYAPPPSQNGTIDLDKLPQNQSYHHTEAQLNPSIEKLEFPRNDIIYLRDIGQGAFGRVFQVITFDDIQYVVEMRDKIYFP